VPKKVEQINYFLLLMFTAISLEFLTFPFGEVGQVVFDPCQSVVSSRVGYWEWFPRVCRITHVVHRLIPAACDWVRSGVSELLPVFVTCFFDGFQLYEDSQEHLGHF